MIGLCMDAGATTSLVEGQEYYVFPHGPNAFYVSKFNNEKAHFGAYTQDRFKIIEKEEAQEVEPPTFYKAVVNVETPWWRFGREYIIGPTLENGYYNVYLPTNGLVVATLQRDIFKKIGPCSLPTPKKQIKARTGVSSEREPMVLPNDEKPENRREFKPKINIKVVHVQKKKVKPEKKKRLNKFEQLEEAGQMTIFDFEGG